MITLYLLELARNAGECGAELRPYCRDHGDNGGSNAGGDQTVFDRSRSCIASEEPNNLRHFNGAPRSYICGVRIPSGGAGLVAVDS